ncbi:MAG TPA: hypothetical protein VKB46_05270 [Pyrinomonadaceae bacterium]|nr:hypothetical protein [Pyrinomonadaceae bacterium]
MADPLNWKTRLEVRANGKVISAIDSFTPTFNTQTTPIHSIEADNIGAIFHPQTATFTITLKAIGPAVAELTKFAISGTKFDISVAENRGSDWTFKKMLFRDCLITSANPSNVVIDGAPAATFNGIILGFTADSDLETPSLETP